MAAPFSCVCCTPIPSSSSSTLSANRINPDLTRQKPTAGSSWWAPIFGWSPNPDYIATSSSSSALRTGSPREVSGQVSKFRPGSFTEDKAKELRKMTIQSSNFHDIMYHSSIASRLASDISDR